MRSSEALILGSVMLKAHPGSVYIRDKGREFGCAIGMIAAGSGHLKELQDGNLILPGWMYEEVILPCQCGGFTKHRIEAIVMHLFDNHVFRHTGDHFDVDGKQLEKWTLDQIADWLYSIEPKELPAPKEAEVQVAVGV